MLWEFRVLCFGGLGFWALCVGDVIVLWGFRVLGFVLWGFKVLGFVLWRSSVQGFGLCGFRV